MCNRISYKYVLKWLLSLAIIAVCIMLFVPLLLGTYFYLKADFKCPTDSIELSKYQLIYESDSIRIIENDFMRMNKYGLWEARISGDALERGAKYGLLTKELLNYQESVFVEQIKEIVPSDLYMRFLHKLIVIFSSNMANYIPEEYRKEIYAISKSCSHEFDTFGTPYERQLNYHAAHDVGHAMQEYMLVGCSSFAAWGEKTSDSLLLVGRNFDFYVGDKFAKNKIILFTNPSSGYNFVSVTWPGMIGVVSGMNECGLTVTINASKGEIPISSAMPISLLVRKIIQYASNIEEALEIAKSHKTFVSESILVGSSSDGATAIIEKSPNKTALYTNKGDFIICTNHYQSKEFETDTYNIENINYSDSKYRFTRLTKLVADNLPLDINKAVDILRDRRGLNNEDIGYTNQKSINQSIAHHSVIFQPKQLRMWVSTTPWQNGTYVCYELKKAFSADTHGTTLYNPIFTIDADSTFIKNDLPKIVQFRQQTRKIKNVIEKGEKLTDEFIDDYIALNPYYFATYDLIGDYYKKINKQIDAVNYWKKALGLEIPTLIEKENINNKINNNN